MELAPHGRKEGHQKLRSEIGARNNTLGLGKAARAVVLNL